jgi:NAD(P)-dependent dehydrogenase (short-subunit alcohol dehydrogenase family)
VAATSRQPQAVAAAFPAEKERLMAASMDLRDPKQISSVVEQAVARFGRIDILVNNAGYGVTGAVEEATEKEIANVYDTNVFGLLRVTRAVLPHMRKQRSGHIVNLSSIGGLTGMPGWGIYNSTKFAVEGLSEALAAELAPLGIGVPIVDFLGGSLVKTANVLPDYATTAGKTRASAAERNRKQQGDPAAAADAIVQAVTSPEPPLHLILGKFAYDRMDQKLNDFRREMEHWRDLTLGTDFKT